MFNMFDMMQSQGGPDLQAFGRQFGLSQDQTRRAMEALMPALTMGLQRSATSDPTGFGRFLGLMAPNPYGVAQPQIPMQPDMLFGQLFGSPLVSQAVLQQAAAASGIGTQALKQMLPVMAGMIVAGIVHVMINQPQQAAPVVQRPAPPPEPIGNPVANFWSDWMEGFLSPPAKSKERAESGNGRPNTERTAAPMPFVIPPPQPAAAPVPPPTPAPEKPSTPAASEASFDSLQEMLQTGMQVQEQNVKAMQDIFDAFWSAQNAGKAAESLPQAGSAQSNLRDEVKSSQRTKATEANKTSGKTK